MGEYKQFEEIIPILEKGVPTLIDDTYIEFKEQNESFVKHIDKYPNLIITKLFQSHLASGVELLCYIQSRKYRID